MTDVDGGAPYKWAYLLTYLHNNNRCSTNLYVLIHFGGLKPIAIKTCSADD